MRKRFEYLSNCNHIVSCCVIFTIAFSIFIHSLLYSQHLKLRMKRINSCKLTISNSIHFSNCNFLIELIFCFCFRFLNAIHMRMNELHCSVNAYRKSTQTIFISILCSVNSKKQKNLKMKCCQHFKEK